MKARKSFTVTNPPINLWLCLAVLGFFGILVLAYSLFSPPPHTAMYICITIFVFIPGTIIAFWTGLYRIKVTGTQISVRKGLGLVNFKSDITEITSVKWKTVETRFGQNIKITVITSKRKKFRIEYMMVNFGRMEKFLKENVDESKIHYTIKKLR